MRLPLWAASKDGRTVELATCKNCGQTKLLSNPCGFDHLAALLEFKAAAA